MALPTSKPPLRASTPSILDLSSELQGPVQWIDAVSSELFLLKLFLQKMQCIPKHTDTNNASEMVQVSSSGTHPTY